MLQMVPVIPQPYKQRFPLKAVLPRKFKLLCKAIILEPVELLKLVLMKVTSEFVTPTVTPAEGIPCMYGQFRNFMLKMTKFVDTAKIPNCVLHLTTVLPVFDPIKVRL